MSHSEMGVLERESIEPMPIEHALLESSTSVETEDSRYVERTVNAIREGSSVAGFLRICGAGLLVFSLSLFLLQGMTNTSELQRYFLLLAQTLLLTAAGFAVGLGLKEAKGARVFLSLALISVPANFAVLGAMIYSFLPMDAALTNYPPFAHWQSTGIKELLIASVAGAVVLIPMTVFCFAVLARNSKWWLSIVYLCTSVFLLIPLRETLSITLISVLCSLLVISVLTVKNSTHTGLATGEEKFAKALLFIPGALILARSATLYSVDFHFALAVSTIAYFLLRGVLVEGVKHSTLKTFVRILTLSSSLAIAVFVGVLIAETYYFMSPLLAFNLVFLALNIELLRHDENKSMSVAVHSVWAVLCFATAITNLMLFSYVGGLWSSLVLALLLLATSVALRLKFGIVLGLLAITAVVYMNGFYIISGVMSAGWVGLAIAGATIILAGSMLEKFWPVIKLRFFKRNAGPIVDDSDLVNLDRLDAQK